MSIYFPTISLVKHYDDSFYWRLCWHDELEYLEVNFLNNGKLEWYWQDYEENIFEHSKNPENGFSNKLQEHLNMWNDV